MFEHIEQQQLFCDHEAKSMRERLRGSLRPWPATSELQLRPWHSYLRHNLRGGEVNRHCRVND